MRRATKSYNRYLDRLVRIDDRAMMRRLIMDLAKGKRGEMIVTQEILEDWKKHPEHEIEASARQTSSIDFNCGPDMNQVMKNWDSDVWRNAYKENWENLKEIRKQELELKKMSEL